jgi:hypothetical protein
MTKRPINKLSDKLSKVDETINIHMYDNGYMVEVPGRDSEDDWSTAKLMCATIEDVIALIHEASNIKRS